MPLDATPRALARCRTMFRRPSQRSDADRQEWGQRMVEAKRQAAARRAAEQTELAREIGGRDTDGWVVEHLPLDPVYVSPQRQRELWDREWVGPTQRNTITGEVSHMVRRRVGDQFVTERVEGPAP